MSVLRSLDEFISKAIGVHGNKFIYDLVTYINTKTPVDIICKTHGVFKQTPKNHLVGKGCPLCAKINRSLSTATFISKSSTKHNNKYIYKDVNYVGNRYPVDIHCPTHGVFTQVAADHLAGSGCPTCAIESRTVDITKFISAGKLIHNNKYIYDRVVHYNRFHSVEIDCPIHGSFWQSPKRHLAGRGCHKCADKMIWLSMSKGNPSCVYLIRLTNKSESFYKVGVTTTSIDRRCRDFRGYTHEIISTRVYIEPACAFDKELEIKLLTASSRYIPSSKFNGSVTECLSIDFDISLITFEPYTQTEVLDFINKVRPDITEIGCVLADNEVRKVTVIFPGDNEPTLIRLDQLLPK